MPNQMNWNRTNIVTILTAMRDECLYCEKNCAELGHPKEAEHYHDVASGMSRALGLLTNKGVFSLMARVYDRMIAERKSNETA